MSETNPINPIPQESLLQKETIINQRFKDFLTGQTEINDKFFSINQHEVNLSDEQGTSMIKLGEFEQDGTNYSFVGYKNKDGQRVISAIETPSEPQAK